MTDYSDFLTLAGVFFGAAVAAYVGYFKKAAPEKHIELAGALVDAGAVRELTAALRDHTAEALDARRDHEKAREAAYRMIEACKAIADEMEELRRVIADIGKDLMRGAIPPPAATRRRRKTS